MPEQSHTPSGAPPANYSGPKRSLVLSGGGMRLSYQAGVIRALFEHGLCFDHMDGTSGGSLNLSMILAGLSPEECCDRWRSQNPKHFAGFRKFSDYLDAGNLTAMGSADGVVDKVFPHLGIDASKIRSASGVQGTYNILNYNQKVTEVIEHKKIETDLIVAGMSLPGVMPPVVKDGTTYLDTGFMQDANPWEAARRGAEEIWLVWCMGNTPTYRGGALEIYVQMLEMSANGALNVQFDRIAELNARIVNGNSPFGQTKPVILHTIRPEYPLPLDPDLFLDKIDHATLIDMGYADAQNYLATMSPLGEAPSPALTQMKDPRLGVRFRETMSGGLSLGESDPETGAKKAKGDENQFALHATIDIRDIDFFTSDPQHSGTLTGRIDYPPFGMNILGYNGAFKLFSPSHDPKMKLMVYQLSFIHGGKTYFLSGEKRVKDDPGLDTWSDTTTLYTILHQGEDDSSPIVGAGILKLSLGQLVDMLKTFTATNATSATEKMRATTKFGTLFLGKLWETHSKWVGD